MEAMEAMEALKEALYVNSIGGQVAINGHLVPIEFAVFETLKSLGFDIVKK